MKWGKRTSVAKSEIGEIKHLGMELKAIYRSSPCLIASNENVLIWMSWEYLQQWKKGSIRSMIRCIMYFFFVLFTIHSDYITRFLFCFANLFFQKFENTPVFLHWSLAALCTYIRFIYNNKSIWVEVRSLWSVHNHNVCLYEPLPFIILR